MRYQTIRAPRLDCTEAQFQGLIMDLAAAVGWLRFHARKVRVAEKRGNEIVHRWATPYEGDGGFPDLVLVRAPFTVIAELKDRRGQLADDQKVWRRQFEGCPGVIYKVWRPADWDDVVATLMRRS